MHRNVKTDPRWAFRHNQQFITNMGVSADFPDQPPPTNKEAKAQEILGSKLATYRTDGLVKVNTRTGPISMKAPVTWPPIPPAYYPNGKVLIELPYAEVFQISDRPTTQINGRVPVIRAGGRSQKGWWSFNPGVIDVRKLEDSPADNVTTYSSHIPWSRE